MASSCEMVRKNLIPRLNSGMTLATGCHCQPLWTASVRLSYFQSHSRSKALASGSQLTHVLESVIARITPGADASGS